MSEIRNEQPYPDRPHEWTRPLATAPDLTAELPALPAASFWADPEEDVIYDEPRHEKPKTGWRFTAGVPWVLAAAAVVVALVSAASPFGAATMTYPSPTAQPAPKPAPVATRTVRVTPPAVTVQAAPRPAQTVYVTKTAVTVVTKTAEPKPAATVTVTATKTVTAGPAPEDVTP